MMILIPGAGGMIILSIAPLQTIAILAQQEVYLLFTAYKPCLNLWIKNRMERIYHHG